MLGFASLNPTYPAGLSESWQWVVVWISDEVSDLAIDMVVAWRIYHLTKLGRETPNMPCTVFFEDAEWKALVAYKTQNPIPPENPPTLREAIHMVASLGGFLGRKCDGEPGTQTLWLVTPSFHLTVICYP